MIQLIFFRCVFKKIRWGTAAIVSFVRYCYLKLRFVCLNTTTTVNGAFLNLIDQLTGNNILKSEPLPGLLSAIIVPPWFSATFKAMASPTPVPLYSAFPCSR